MKKHFLIITLTACIPVLLCTFTGCAQPFNVRGIGLPFEFREDFLKANRTYGALYWNEIGHPGYAQSYEWDETSPEFRTFIIAEKTRMDEVFSVYPGIDFKKEMVIVHLYTSSSTRETKITNITLNNKILKIEFKRAKGKPFHKDESSPRTVFLVLRMDKLDIDTVEFNRIR